MLGTKRASLLRDLDSGPRPKSKDGAKKNIWSSMLDNVASGKKLPEKNVIVLGGTPESQKEFLEILSSDPSKPRLSADRRSNQPPPVANQFALGYTFQDVLDADQEDVLARLSIYLLSDPSPSFAPLLKPLFTAKSIPETLVVILLDWGAPWGWIRQLREWIRILRRVLGSLGDEEKVVMQEVMTEWTDRKRGGDGPGGMAGSNGTVLPPGPGEWDEGLGVPMCVVCQGADKIAKLEKENGWREEQFDYVLQFMRTVLLKHGSSLIYTTPFLANSLQTLLHSSLDIYSTLKRQSLKHNVIDKDKILVPSNWDSWGKIRIIGDGFDMEGIGAAWSAEIDEPPTTRSTYSRQNDDESAQNDKTENGTPSSKEPNSTTVSRYEQTIRDPKAGSAASKNSRKPLLEVETMDTQDFLAKQAEVIEKLKKDEEERSTKTQKSSGGGGTSAVIEESGRVLNEHIGPVQFNMGGIQVDADDMVKRLKEQQANTTPKKEKPVASSVQTPEESNQTNEALAKFFKGLASKRTMGGSPRATPTPP